VLKKSTIQLLRFKFSFFLLPVYCFGLSQTATIHWGRALAVFLILHVLVYPASNGYNSYMDRDTGSIGGIQNPMPPTRQLFYASLLLDVLAIGASIFISLFLSFAIVVYILASRAYSYRGIRLKKYPVIGYLTVFIFQGAWVYALVKQSCGAAMVWHADYLGMIAASAMMGSFYPLTQIYQHQQDEADGVTTLSMLLGYRGTFIFTGLVFTLAMILLAFLLVQQQKIYLLALLQIFFLPVAVYFFWWFAQVIKNTAAANFKHTMRMNILASVCTNAAFITLLIVEKWQK
jgi:1,4-dihydroxy-2-naphthoate polyprenyltransferase